MQKLAPVRSLGDLRRRAEADPAYRALAIAAARNLGAPAANPTLTAALAWLRLNAEETTEEGVVDEVNFLRDLDGCDLTPERR